MKIIPSGKKNCCFFRTESEAILCPPINCQIKGCLGIGYHGIWINAHKAESSIISKANWRAWTVVIKQFEQRVKC